jgi:hypothetical protein
MATKVGCGLSEAVGLLRYRLHLGDKSCHKYELFGDDPETDEFSCIGPVISKSPPTVVTAKKKRHKKSGSADLAKPLGEKVSLTRA